MCGGPSLLLLALASCAPVARPVLSEILYDAAGDDEGLEFIEIHNPTSGRADLAGLRLEAGDGSGPGRWTLKWTAPAGTALEPGARLVIGGARVAPAPGVVAELGLQNGPDAVRLVWPDGATEVLGYGALGYAEYACGRPAADVASGQSLARVPDDADLGENALDFRAAAPSPGRANRPGRHVAWLAGTLAIDPENAAPGAPVRLSGRGVNAGADSIRGGELVARALLRGPGGLEERGRTVLPGPVAPGETLAVAVEAPAPAPGVHTWVAELALAGDEDPDAGRDSLRVRVGPGPLELTEIQYHPKRGEGEWVEVANRSGGSIDVAGFALRDRGGTRGVPRAALACAPDSLVLLAQDPAKLLEAYPRLDPARVVALAPWPSLNNSNGSDGTADALELRDAEDLPSDRAVYSATGIPAGVPIERARDGRWRADSDPAGTPLAPPRTLPPQRGAFAVLRSRLAPGAPSVRIGWSLPWESARIRVDAYDLTGARIASLMSDTEVAGRGEGDLGVAELAPGLTILVLRAHPTVGGAGVTASQLLRIDGVAR